MESRFITRRYNFRSIVEGVGFSEMSILLHKGVGFISQATAPFIVTTMTTEIKNH